MSKKKIKTRCIVIDASIAYSACPPSSVSPDPRGAKCRTFLSAIVSIGHRMAWNEEIKAEWDRRQKNWATAWRVAMTRMHKLQKVSASPNAELRQAINDHSDDSGVIKKMQEDALLVEAALDSDLRIASLDDNARGHYRRLAASFDSIAPIHWVNLEHDEEKAIEWLKKGAPDQDHRRLA